MSGSLFYASGTGGDVSQWDNLEQPASTQVWKSKILTTQDMVNFGAARVIADYVDTETQDWDTFTDTWEATTFSWTVSTDVSFKFYADQGLVYSNTISNKDIFRLPTGFRTDTYEVELESNIRIRSVHLAETPIALKAV